MAEEWTIEMKRRCGRCGGTGFTEAKSQGASQTLPSSGRGSNCQYCNGKGSEVRHLTLAKLKKLLATA